jgi:hypothetical protein
MSLDLASLRLRLASLSARLPTGGLWALRGLVGLAAITAISAYFTLAVIHLRFPFELEWMEGGLVDEARRASSGQALYVKPTLGYVPYIYPPLWFWVAGLSAKLLGAGFFSARLVSVLASFGAVTLVYALVLREGKNHLAALLAAGVYAATYRIASSFFDIARVDSLYVLLLLAGIYVLRARSSPRSRLLAAAIFTLAYLTKQSAPLVFAPLALHVLVAERWKRGLFFAAGGALMMGASTLLLDLVHHGWYRYFVFTIPSLHPLVPKMWTTFWTEDLLGPLPVCLFLAFLVVTVDRGAEGRRFWAAALVGMLAASWMGRLHAGGWTNVIMPGYAILAVLLGLAVAHGLSLAGRRPSVEAALLALAGLQLVLLHYDPRPFVPTAGDVAAGKALVERIRRVEGDVYLPARGHLAAMAGKRTLAQEMAVSDVIGMGGGRPGAALKAEILDAIARKRFGAIIIDTDLFKREIDASYRFEGPLFTQPEGFWPVTGMRVRPKALYVPR